MKTITILLILILISACSINKYQLAGDDKNFLIDQITKLSQESHISKRPILVVDGVEYVKTKDINLEEIDLTKDSIKEIELLKKDPAIRIFGKAGERGVLVITTKSTDDK